MDQPIVIYKNVPWIVEAIFFGVRSTDPIRLRIGHNTIKGGYEWELVMLDDVEVVE